MGGYMVYPKVKKKLADSWSSKAQFNCLVLIVAMSFYGWIFAQNASLFLSAGHWLPTEAYILHSKINKGHRGGPDSPWIEYCYVVGSRTYVSDRIDFGEWSYDDILPTYIRNLP